MFAQLSHVSAIFIFDEKAVQLFANEVKRIRKEKGMSQAKLALESGIPLSSIERIEGAKINPTLSTIAAIARALDVRMSALLDFDLPKEDT